MAGNAIFMCAVADVLLVLMIRERAAFPSRPWNTTDDVYMCQAVVGDALEAGEAEKCCFTQQSLNTFASPLIWHNRYLWLT